MARPLFALLLVLCIALSACARSSAPHAARTLPRADPGYVQWLERQSFLGTASQYTGIVSGSDLLWRASSTADTAETLLTAAHAWLWVHPQTLLTTGMRPVLAELADAPSLRVLKAAGLHGLYLAPSGESGGVWEYRRAASSTGEDITAPTWSPAVGTEEQFHKLANLAAKENFQLGTDIVPAATGLGPDFFLAARNVRDYPGSYVMLEVPEELWPSLPPVPQEWAAAPLNAEHVAALADKQTLPPALARDHLSWSLPGGWAVTGVVRGSDGVRRRWAYRYQGTAQRPVLNWDDPSGSGKKIFSASIIRQIGTLRQTLGGLHTEALFGLDAAPLHQEDAPTLEPAPSAMNTLAREIRRYGGWSVQRDALPPALLGPALATGVDFTADTVTAPAAEYALLTGDTAPLTNSLKTALADRLDQRRLLRTLPGVDGVDLRFLGPTEARQKLAATLAKQPAWAPYAPLHANTLYAGAATLAALSAGISPEAAHTDAARAEILRRHLLLTAFRAGLPGLLMLSGQDLAGVLRLPSPPEDPTLAMRGAWSFGTPARAALTRQGTPLAVTAYAPPLEQLDMEGSYVREAAKLMELRERYGIARAVVTAVCPVSRPGSAAVLLRLPDGRHILTLTNFSADGGEERITLPPDSKARTVDSLWGQGDASLSGTTLRVRLAPWQCQWFLLSPA